MKHQILSGSIEQVTNQLNKIELDWDVEVVSSALSQMSEYLEIYTVIIKTLRPKY